jgi:hypothetical protein
MLKVYMLSEPTGSEQRQLSVEVIKSNKIISRKTRLLNLGVSDYLIHIVRFLNTNVNGCGWGVGETLRASGKRELQQDTVTY